MQHVVRAEPVIPPLALRHPLIQGAPNPRAFSFWARMPTAILIDGAFFINRFRKIEPHNAYNAPRAGDLVRISASVTAHFGHRDRLSRDDARSAFRHRDRAFR